MKNESFDDKDMHIKIICLEKLLFTRGHEEKCEIYIYIYIKGIIIRAKG